MNKLLLFTPGPLNVADNIKLAITKKDICHREPDFEVLLRSVEEKLLCIFGLNSNTNYRAVIITGSGTAANESILSSVVGDKKILILSNGEFGERLFKISKGYNKNTLLLEFPWGKAIDPQQVVKYLECEKVDFVMMVHHETSSGMLNPLTKISQLVRKSGALFMLDCVSSAGAETIDMEKNHIAFSSSSSSKAIGSYPGLSCVVGKISEFEKLQVLSSKTTYLNLHKFYYFLKTLSQTPNTPAIPLFYALEQALVNILKEGFSNHQVNIIRKACLLRKGMEKLGFTFVLKQNEMSSVLSTIYIPQHITVKMFRDKLREKSIIIYEGKGCYKNKAFQVGNIGELSLDSIQYFLDSVKTTLQELKPIKVVSTI